MMAFTKLSVFGAQLMSCNNMMLCLVLNGFGLCNAKREFLILTFDSEYNKSQPSMCMKGPLMLKSVANWDTTYGCISTPIRWPLGVVRDIRMGCGSCPKHLRVSLVLAVPMDLSGAGMRSFSVNPIECNNRKEMHECQLLPESRRANTFLPDMRIGRYFGKESDDLASWS